MRDLNAFYEAIRQHDYTTADQRFQRLKRSVFPTFTSHHFSDMLRALRTMYKETQATQVMLYAEQLGELAVKAFPQSSYLQQLFGWVRYDKYLKNNNSAVAVKITVAEDILRTTVAATYSPYEATLWKLLNLYEERNMPLQTCLTLLQRLDRTTLSRDELHYMQQGQMKTYPSSRERYYRKFIHYTYELQQYKECYRACYQLLYESHLTVSAKFPVHKVMLDCLQHTHRLEEAIQFAHSLAQMGDQRYIEIWQSLVTIIDEQ